MPDSIVHSSFECYLSFHFPHFLYIVKRPAMSMAQQISEAWDVESSGFMTKSSIAGPYGRFSFSVLRFFHTDFCSDDANLYPYHP